jgi:hypothetical protein
VTVRINLRRPALLALALLAMLGLGAPGTADADDARYKKALKDYKKSMRDDALSSRNSGRVQLASTRHPRAFEVLRKDYAKPERPKDEVRYLIAEGASIYFDVGFADPWREWMQAEDKPRDAWLWFHGCAACLKSHPATEVRRRVGPEKDVFLRAAAIEALATHVSHEEVQASDVTKRILLELQGLPPEPERGVLVGSLATLALSLQPYLKQADVRSAVAKIIKQIDHEHTPPWAQLAVARRIAKLTGMPLVTLQTPVMLAALAGTARHKAASDERYADPTFMGVKATGTRICYVIDCSDSMLLPLTPEEKEALRAPALKGAGPKRADSKKAAIPAQLDWSKIRNRFDAAREFLKLSLARLTKDQSFAIVCFGSKAALLKGVPGMRPAIKARVRRAILALNAMKAKPGTALRVDGLLLGDTNLHAALRLAFRVTRGGQIKGSEHVDVRAFTEGCDTMFLLTDGLPTVDDYAGTKEGWRMEGGGSYDPETRTRTGSGGFRLRAGKVNVKGPYASSGPRWLEGDVQRMNMFRKVEIHCVGLGEADEGYLRSLAHLGLGTVHLVGSER